MPKEGSTAERKFAPVILAGGSGTRFWPRSRKARAKQVLALDGERTMIQQTVTRLLPLAAAKQFWIITNQDLRPEIVRQLRRLTPDHVIADLLLRYPEVKIRVTAHTCTLGSKVVCTTMSAEGATPLMVASLMASSAALSMK